LLVAACGILPSEQVDRKPPNIDAEPNDTFANALRTTLDSGGSATLEGELSGPSDLDVFSLGTLSAGDRLIIDVDSLTSGLDVSIAVFDQDFNLFLANDDENLGSGQLDSYLDGVIRHDGKPYYLVVGPSSFAAVGSDVGTYRAAASIIPTGAIPPPNRQYLLVNFDGGRIEPDGLLTKDLPTFDAKAIDPGYAGQDERIKKVIVETMRENYAGFEVEIATDLAEIPLGEAHSTIMFGGRSRIAFGIAEAVDSYNSNLGDMAVIFTASFDPFRFTRTPSADELGLAIGNVASHEAGHLLGLNHVTDATDLMDARSPADTFVQDQDFRISVLSDDILPIGYQDSPLLLSETVGLRAGYNLPAARSRPIQPGVRLKAASSMAWCGTCNRKLGR